MDKAVCKKQMFTKPEGLEQPSKVLNEETYIDN